MSKGYEERTMGERRCEKTTMARGPCKLVGGKTIEVTGDNLEGWRVWKWGYKYQSIEADPGWRFVGYSLVDPELKTPKVRKERPAEQAALPQARVVSAVSLVPIWLWPAILSAVALSTIGVLEWLS